MKLWYLPTFALIALTLFSNISKAQETAHTFPADGANHMRFAAEMPPLVPLPQELKWGEKLSTLRQVNIKFQGNLNAKKDSRVAQIHSELSNFLKQHEVELTQNAPYTIRFVLGAKPLRPFNEGTPEWKNKSAYILNSLNGETSIHAFGIEGLYHGLQTLKQLIIRREGKTTIAHARITDWPDMQIRGFMNDVGRNYMPLELIKQEIDAMSELKFNVYHFHFTENDGWRLQSKIFPELTAPKNTNRMPGKFYTQKEFVELLHYCRNRGIQLIPELDMPGHTAAFRKALGIEKMSDPKAGAALVKLINELCSLAPAELMPYIHIGTDEAKAHEQVNDATLRSFFETVEKNGRTPIRWQHGLNPRGYKGAIEQLWCGRGMKKSWPSRGAKSIDSHETYVNHLDPFETASTFYFRRPCPFKHAEGLGFILCSWPDLPIEDPRNQLLQTPIYQSLAFVAEPLWHNPHPPMGEDPMQDELGPYFNNLPPAGSPLLEQFKQYEDRVLALRDRFLSKNEFTYVRQSDMRWRIIGPFPNGGDTSKSFAVEDILKTAKVKNSYREGDKEYSWDEREFLGATIIFKHYCGNPTLFSGGKWPSNPAIDHTYYALQYIYSPKAQSVPFWISGHTWATSDWRQGPVSVAGEWFHAQPKFWLNGKEIPAPKWQKPGNNGAMTDENYHFPDPTMLPRKKGWKQLLVKSPSNKNTRRWMFTFTPVKIDDKAPMGQNIKEYPQLQFSTSIH